MKQEIGARIRDIRLSKGIKVKELADEADLTSSHISQIERGIANPSLNTIEKIAEVLDVSMASLFAEPNGTCTLIKAEERALIPFEGLMIESLTPSQFSDWPLFSYITGAQSIHEKAGRADTDSRAKGRTYQHAGYEMILVLEGSAVWHVGDETFSLSKGDALCYQATSKHWSEDASDDFKVLVVATQR